MTTRIGILFFSQFDLIDAGGPYEVFLTAARLMARDGEDAELELVLLSPDGGDVTSYGGMTLTTLTAVQDAGALDVVVVPGLIDLDAARSDAAVMDAVALLADRSDLVTSVCTGAFLLADAGIVDGMPVTTHWEDVPDLDHHPRVESATASRRWVDNGAVITGGALTSGMHMALHVVDRLWGRARAEQTARQLDLPWDPTGVRP